MIECVNLHRSGILSPNYKNTQHNTQCINLVFLFQTFKKNRCFKCIQYRKMVSLKILENTSYASKINTFSLRMTADLQKFFVKMSSTETCAIYFPLLSRTIIL